MATFDPLDYGARGDGETLDTGSLQRALDACAGAGGGTVVIPSGRALVAGAFELRSSVELRLEPGAHLLAAAAREHYPGGVWILADRAEDVSITGPGTIDGRGLLFMTERGRYIHKGVDWRPMTIRFADCRRVRLRDFSVRDAAHWAVHVAGCDDCSATGLSIVSDLRIPNCDGIDVDCSRNVRISGCHVAAGDDAICLKSDWDPARACEAVTVTGCTLCSTSCAVKLGSGTSGDIRGIVVDSCAIHASNRGLGIQHRDGGALENIIFSNCVVETRLFHDAWWGKAEPIHVTNLRRSEGAAPPGPVRNVRFVNVLCRGEGGVYVEGDPDAPPEGLLFENVRVEIARSSKWPGGMRDRRPCAREETVGLVRARAHGFFMMHARDVTVRNCEVAWGNERPEWFGRALEAHGVDGLGHEGLRGRAAHPDRDEAVLVEP